MGTAQLLYITLGVIVVGIAIVVGMNMVSSYYQESNREQLITHSLRIISKAQEYYMKSSDLGGGGGTYKNFDLSDAMLDNEIGTFKLKGNNNRLNINAKGVVDGNNGNKPVRVIARLIRNNKNPDGKIVVLIRN